MKIKIGQKLFMPSKSTMVVVEIGDNFFITKDLVGVFRKFKTSTMCEMAKHPITAYTSIDDVEHIIENKVLTRKLGLSYGWYFSNDKLKEMLQKKLDNNL